MAARPIPKFEMRHRLYLALEYANVPVIQIARELGVSRTTISNYIHGRTEPRRADLIAWAMICGVPLDWLITGEEPADTSPAPDPELGSGRTPTKKGSRKPPSTKW